MKFIFNGTLDELKETIHLKAKEYNKDIVIYDNESNILEIGFQRLSHNGGRFFIANVTDESNKVILDGEIKDVFPSQKKSKFGRIWSEFTEYLFAYIFLEILLIIPWLFLRNIISTTLPDIFVILICGISVVIFNLLFYLVFDFIDVKIFFKKRNTAKSSY